jgi:CheY-like chemotaxis protein
VKGRLRVARILVVDDEADERFLVRRMFERAGHEVRDARDGVEALRAVGEFAPDLVVTDMMMPVMDGARFIAELRAEPATAAVLIVVSSGDTHLAVGADAVIPKSRSFDQLKKAADALLERRHGQC